MPLVTTWMEPEGMMTKTEAHFDIRITRIYLFPLLCVGSTEKMQQSDSEDLLRSAPTGSPDLGKDDGNHDPRAVDQRLERSSQ